MTETGARMRVRCAIELSRGSVRRALAIVCALALVAALPGQGMARSGVAGGVASGVAGVAGVEVIAGSDRFATSVALSRAAFPSGARTVLIATGLDWPDALGGAALAGAAAAPILLVRPNALTAEVAAEVRRLAPDEAYVLGGERAVGDRVTAALSASLPASATVTRLAGADRYATAARVAAEVRRLAAATSDDGTAFVATGRGFADALAAGPLAAALGRPVYLLDNGPASAATLQAMRVAGIRRAIVLGDTSAIPAALASRLREALGAGAVVERVSGADRYETAIAIARRAETEASFTWTRPALANGMRFPDALAAAPLLATRRSPLLLTPPSGLADGTASVLYSRRDAVQAFTALGGPAALAPHVRQEAVHALLAPAFSGAQAMRHVKALAALGPRAAGSSAERKAFDYIAARLTESGYAVSEQHVTLPGGRHSHNVVAEKRGSSAAVVLLGAHADSKPPSPGANDNASGVGVVLELARVLAAAPTQPTVRFVAFGAEEIAGDSADDHHFGSRQYVKALSSAEKAAISGMVSVDMVGYGSTFNVRSMGTGPQAAVKSLRTRASFTATALPYLRDPGRYGWSDHEAFERVGIPAAWLEWRNDPVYHTTRDTASHVQPSRVRESGRLLRGWLLAMTSTQLDALR